MPTTAEIICQLASKISGHAVVDPGIDLRTDLPIGSIQVVEIVVAVEDHFGIELVSSELSGVTSIAALAALCDAKRRP